MTCRNLRPGGVGMSGVAEWFEQLGEIPIVTPPGMRAYLPIADDPVGPPTVAGDTTIEGLTFGMEYCDARGCLGTRVVRCCALDASAPARMQAFCTTERAVRTFRLDRIISVLNFRTGALMSGEEHYALFAPHLLPAGDANAKAVRALQAVACDGLAPLVALAMPDGRLREPERSILLAFLDAEAQTAGLSTPERRSLELWVENFIPSLQTVLAAVARVLDQKDRFARFLPWATRIIRSRQGFAEQEEQIRGLIAAVREHYRDKLREPARLRAQS